MMTIAVSPEVKPDAAARSPQGSSGAPFLYSHKCFMVLYFTEATRVSEFFSLWLAIICLFASPKLCSLNTTSFIKLFLAGKVDTREHELRLPITILNLCFMFVAPKHIIFILYTLKDCAHVNTRVLNLIANLIYLLGNSGQQHILSMISLGNKNVKNKNDVSSCQIQLRVLLC